MPIRERLTTVAVSACLVAGSIFAVPAAASAATTQRAYGSATTKAQCQSFERLHQTVVRAGGGNIGAGEACRYNASKKMWQYFFLYRQA
ncbi:hypothetical protein [Microbacterium radiodurans]|uniref:Secreted protein n=1 Tax=Microbacterium radiodurans TaxID=661398 RepID=A0A5J5IQG6_9MICO|nr:hypothetical protein [Microbacterium radiodurans]KAA9084950.1 hypothetical protein F6B42_10550 [Microbacterium radiodurans]